MPQELNRKTVAGIFSDFGQKTDFLRGRIAKTVGQKRSEILTETTLIYYIIDGKNSQSIVENIRPERSIFGGFCIEKNTNFQFGKGDPKCLPGRSAVSYKK